MNPADLKSNFRAVLTSGGGHLTESQLSRDYKSLLGQSIPYSQLGHKTVRSLLESLGGFNFTKNHLGETVIHEGYDEKTAHISSLIARQKKKPGASKSKRRPPNYARPKPHPHRLPVRWPASDSARWSSSPPRMALSPRRSLPNSQYSVPIIPQRNYSVPIIPQRQCFVPTIPERQYTVPIIPQRQPLSVGSVQKRLEVSREGTNLNITDGRTKVVSVNSSGTSPVSEVRHTNVEPPYAKESSIGQEPSGDATFIDIQWLTGKVASKLHPQQVEKMPAQTCRPTPCPTSLPQPASRQTLQGTSPSVQKPTISKSVVSPPVKQLAVSPVASSPPVSHPKSSVEELFTLAKELGLGEPEYKCIERRPLRGKSSYVAKVKIGNDLVYSSYSDELKTPEDAQDNVAKSAIADLLKKAKTPQPSVSYLDESTLVQRVYAIVESKPNGMFHDAVTIQYEQDFKARLPSSWLTVIEKCSSFSVESLAGRAIIYPLNTPTETQLPVNAAPSLAAKSSITVQESCLPLRESISQKKKVSEDINANTITLIQSEESLSKPSCGGRNPPKLILPNDSPWDVFVASVSSDEVWVRLIGEEYDVRYNHFMNEMEMNLLNSDGVKVKDVQVHEYYVAKFDNCWLRVQLKEIASDGQDECVVFLIDNGEVDTIPLSELRVLDEEYLQLPPQAVPCKLLHVDLSFEEAQTYLLNYVLGSSFVAEVFQSPSHESNPTIILYNTEVENEPVNINFKILDAVIKNMSKPVIPSSHVAFLRLTSTQNESLPYVQMQGKDLSLLESVLDDLSLVDLIQIYGVNAHPRVGSTVKETHVVARSEKAPKSWRRGILINTQDARYPLVYFQDYGYHEKVMWSEIFLTEKILPPLISFPVQAVKINLSGLRADQLVSGVLQRLRDLVPEGQFVLGKVVVSGTENQPPAVELFKRVQPDDMIASINSDLIFNLEEYSKLGTKSQQESRVEPAVGGTSKSTSPLASYPVPAVGLEYFNVKVTLTSNPSNFVVQPFKEANTSFNDMMNEMQSLYEAQHRVMPSPSVREMQEGGAYAAKHPDDLLWYRVTVDKVLNDTTVTVRYCDYGDVGVVTVDRLRYLETKFRQVPSMAIKAKLHGVKPKNVDWTVEECVFFNSRIEDKALVSRILAVNSDIMNSSWQVSLQIIDTATSDSDIDIAELMIQNGMATRV